MGRSRDWCSRCASLSLPWFCSPLMEWEPSWLSPVRLPSSFQHCRRRIRQHPPCSRHLPSSGRGVTTPPQASPLPQAAPQDAAPTTTAALPDQTELLQTMARELATLERNIEQLKANQQQIVRDSSKAIEELKANQEEMKRALARVSEQNPPKTSQPPTQPTTTLRKPERTLQSPHVRARPRLPRDWIYDEDW